MIYFFYTFNITMNIILNSNNNIGNNLFDAKFLVNLENLIEYKDFNKDYELSFSMKSQPSYYLKNRLFGVYLRHISNVTLNNEMYFLGLLNTKVNESLYYFDTKPEDNQILKIRGLNRTSIISLEIKDIQYKDVFDNLIWYYKFNTDDISGTTVYNHSTKQYDGNLNNNAEIIEDGVLDLTGIDDWFSMPDFNFDNYSTNALTMSIWFKANTDESVYNIYGDNRDGRFVIFSMQGNNVNLFIDLNGSDIVYTFYDQINSSTTTTTTYQFDNGEYYNIQLVFGNIPTHKIYINGILFKEFVNNDVITGTLTNCRIGQAFSQNYIQGYMQDFRLYSRELTAQEINDLYKSSLSHINGFGNLIRNGNFTTPDIPDETRIILLSNETIENINDALPQWILYDFIRLSDGATTINNNIPSPTPDEQSICLETVDITNPQSYIRQEIYLLEGDYEISFYILNRFDDSNATLTVTYEEINILHDFIPPNIGEWVQHIYYISNPTNRRGSLKFEQNHSGIQIGRINIAGIYLKLLTNKEIKPEYSMTLNIKK